MTKLPPIIWSIIRKLKLGWLVLLAHPKSILIQDGWFASFHTGKPVDRHGRPIPWDTYGFVKFIEKRIKSEFKIFEYGCGFSTLWYGGRVSKVVAVEHNPAWIEQISTHLPKNCQVIHQANPQEYVNEISRHGIFDLIIIDGLKRELCWQPAIEHLAPGGVIIWDDSDRPDFTGSWPNLHKRGFRCLDFYGLAPVTFVSKQTTVLYRDGNCLGI